jgi:CRISPR-associated endonuclease Csn1
MRDHARAKAEEVLGSGNARKKDVELVLLYEECGGICPYTGRQLGGLTSILSGTAAVQVEHIIPRSVSLDDSFCNLTLATTEANAEKGNRTPYEAYGSDEQRYEQIIQRVSKFKGPFALAKLQRFQLDKEGKQKLLAEFSTRHLNDTRYASRLAAEYLGLLYGGEIAGGKRKIVKATGQVTADLRGLWDLNRILSGDARKSREDHRHHAIDAAVLAVVGHKWIQRLSEAAENAWKERKRRYASVEPPWVGFKEELDKAIQAMHISYRPDHRITGGLHKDTNYSYVGKNERDGDIVRVRKPVHLLGKDDIDKIVDPAVRAVVAAKAAAVGDLKKLETDPPFLPNRNGPPVPVRKVRIELNRAVRKVGKGHKARYAEGSETHHVEVCEVTQKGKRVWRGDVVSMSEAMERLVAGRAVVDRSDTDGRGFLFSLCKGDTVELRDPDGVRTGIWVVRKIAANHQVVLVREHDARLEGERDAFAPRPSSLQKLCARKVVVDPLGEVLEGHDEPGARLFGGTGAAFVARRAAADRARRRGGTQRPVRTHRRADLQPPADEFHAVGGGGTGRGGRDLRGVRRQTSAGGDDASAYRPRGADNDVPAPGRGGRGTQETAVARNGFEQDPRASCDIDDPSRRELRVGSHVAAGEGGQRGADGGPCKPGVLAAAV